jgi:NAD(P)-dependent dehydrogenase (short-subunit alcohol dehydrogenase family)
VNIPSMRLDDKVAIVTGGGGSLGSVCSLGLAEAGAAVVVAGQTLSKCDRTAEAIREHGGRALAIQVDITDADAVKRMVDKTLSTFGRIDILFNNAGIAIPKPFTETTEEEWARVYEVNINGTVLCTNAVASAMFSRRSGRIVNMGSIAGGVGIANRSAYGASKAAVGHLTKTLAIEFGPYGVTVNAICPSVIESELNREFIEKQPQFYQGVLQRTPLGRFGKAEDLVGLLVFLASDAASFVTGQVIYVDGGYTTG